MVYKVILVDKKDSTAIFTEIQRNLGHIPMGARIGKDKDTLVYVIPERAYELLKEKGIKSELLGETYTTETVYSKVWDAKRG